MIRLTIATLCIATALLLSASLAARGALADDANMSAYQSCGIGCQGIFPYRHGTNPEFAGFQKTCLVGCRQVH